MQNTTLGVVLVHDARLLDVWFGGKPLIRHTLDKLEEIRGLDDVCVLVPATDAPKPKKGKAKPREVAAYPWLPGDKTVVFPVVPAGRVDNGGADYALLRWLAREANFRPAVAAEHLLVLRADKPLTPVSHIAQVFYAARDRGDAYAALTGRPVEILDPHNSLLTRFEPTWGVWACHRSFLKEEKPHWCRNFGTIPVGSVESLSLLDRNEELTIQALVNQGHA